MRWALDMLGKVECKRKGWAMRSIHGDILTKFP